MSRPTNELLRRPSVRKAAEALLLALLEDGERYRPGDFEDVLLGGDDLWETRWTDTPFPYALNDLVKDGIVLWTTDDEGVQWYEKTR